MSDASSTSSGSSAESLYRGLLNRRLQPARAGLMDVESVLTDFALINYALPRTRLERYIPLDRFEIPEFEIRGEKMALMSAVPFHDHEFRFTRLLPFKRFSFWQTNYRVYVVDKQSGEHVAWFFGTTLGSHYVHLPTSLWRIPWHFARYVTDCRFNDRQRKYDRYHLRTESAWAEATIDLTDTGEPVKAHEGFGCDDEMKLILTHPVKGYYYRRDRVVGTYAVWHEEMQVTEGTAKELYFGLYQRLGLLTREEMNHPISIFICPRITFRILLPPRKVV